MVGCAAVNCSNRTSPTMRLFRIPTAKDRREVWLHNMRRDWTPGPAAFICQVHFEDSQFEQYRADGWRKLKQNAVPTLFNVSNPPPKISLPSGRGRGNCSRRKIEGPFTEPLPLPKVTPADSQPSLELRQNCSWKGWESLPPELKLVLSKQQVDNVVNRSKASWDDESVIFALRARFALGIHGYEYLRETMNYPLPSLSTLDRRLSGLI